MLSSRDPAIRRGKNAHPHPTAHKPRGGDPGPAGESWPTFIFPASGKDIANSFASKAFAIKRLMLVNPREPSEADLLGILEEAF